MVEDALVCKPLSHLGELLVPVDFEHVHCRWESGQSACHAAAETVVVRDNLEIRTNSQNKHWVILIHK